MEKIYLATNYLCGGKLTKGTHVAVGVWYEPSKNGKRVIKTFQIVNGKVTKELTSRNALRMLESDYHSHSLTPTQRKFCHKRPEIGWKKNGIPVVPLYFGSFWVGIITHEGNTDIEHIWARNVRDKQVVLSLWAE